MDTIWLYTFDGNVFTEHQADDLRNDGWLGYRDSIRVRSLNNQKTYHCSSFEGIVHQASKITNIWFRHPNKAKACEMLEDYELNREAEFLTQAQKRRTRYNTLEALIEKKSEYKVFAKDKDADIGVKLASLCSYEAAKLVAQAYLPLIANETIRRPEHTDTIDIKGEPFDWLYIEKPDGSCEIIKA